MIIWHKWEEDSYVFFFNKIVKLRRYASWVLFKKLHFEKMDFWKRKKTQGLKTQDSQDGGGVCLFKRLKEDDKISQ